MIVCNRIAEVLLVFGLVFATIDQGLAKGKADEWYSNDEMASLYEAISKISSESLVFQFTTRYYQKIPEKLYSII